MKCEIEECKREAIYLVTVGNCKLNLCADHARKLKESVQNVSLKTIEMQK